MRETVGFSKIFLHCGEIYMLIAGNVSCRCMSTEWKLLSSLHNHSPILKLKTQRFILAINKPTLDLVVSQLKSSPSIHSNKLTE
jgi:hypothetical protein